MTKVVIFSIWEIGPNVSYMWRLVVNKFKLSVSLLPINTKSLWQEEHCHFGDLFPLNSNVIIIYTINNVGIFLLVIYFLKPSTVSSLLYPIILCQVNFIYLNIFTFHWANQRGYFQTNRFLRQTIFIHLICRVEIHISSLISF